MSGSLSVCTRSSSLNARTNWSCSNGSFPKPATSAKWDSTPAPAFYRSFEAQERVFERILRACAEHGDKILTVHSVRAVAKVLGHLERNLLPDRGQVVMHWFTGGASDARRAVELGCFFSINAEMLRSPKHRELVLKLPTDRLLTETDGPFVQRDGRPARPRDVAGTVVELAAARGVATSAMADTIVANLARLVTQPASSAASYSGAT
jgi:TatD DNase family protein